MGIPKGDERENVTQEILEFLQINVSHQITNPVNSVNTKQDKCHKKQHLSILFSNNRKSKIQEKSIKEARGKNTLSIEKKKVKITSNFSETTQTGRERSKIVKVCRGKNY